MSNVLILPENTAGRDFVVGDIHGCFDLLEKALTAVAFDPAKDRLISVGDLVDRGPQSAKCLHYLAQPWFFAVRGNHEDIFLEAHRTGLIGKVRDAFKENPDINKALLSLPEIKDKVRKAFNATGMTWAMHETQETLEKILEAFRKLPIAIEIKTERGTVGFVHAEIPSGMDWQTFKQNLDGNNPKLRRVALWGRARVHDPDAGSVPGIDRVFFGHTVQADGPKRIGNCFYIDTGGVFAARHEDDPPHYFLTFGDITARGAAFFGPNPSGKDLPKVVTETPADRKKPFSQKPPIP